MWQRIGRFFKWNRETSLYLFFGGLTTVINYASYILLTRFFLIPLLPSNLVAWILSILFAYVTNRKWVFQVKSKGFRGIGSEFALFLGVRIFSGIADTALMVALVDWLLLDDMVCKLAVNLVVIALNYILSKFLVFRDKR